MESKERIAKKLANDPFRMNKVPSPTEDLIEELKDPEFKKEYGAEQAKLEFAVVLHDTRTQARLTQQQLAGLLGCSQPYIARLEGGEANPTLAAIGRMLAALDLRIVIETVPIKPELGTVPAAVCLKLVIKYLAGWLRHPSRFV